MKTNNVTISGIVAYIGGAAFILLLISVFASCSSPRYYTRTHDGCQQSQGFAGYGNK
jgi:hypothetical protein